MVDHTSSQHKAEAHNRLHHSLLCYKHTLKISSGGLKATHMPKIIMNNGNYDIYSNIKMTPSILTLNRNSSFVVMNYVSPSSRLTDKSGFGTSP